MTKISRVLLTPLLLLTLTPAARAQTFAEFAFSYFERQRLFTPPSLTFVAPSEEVAMFDESSPARKALLELYAKSLPSKPNRWTEQTLPPGFKLPLATIGYTFPNDVLVRAYRDKKLLGVFRPIATLTGCDTGCLPVVFHLRLSGSGRTEAILEDPRWPLTKAFHEKFSADDKRRLLEIARSLPAALEWIDGPPGLADEASSFPPATWTPLRPTLVAKAAYTSYRVFEAALGSRDFLLKDAAKVRNEANQTAQTAEGEWLRTNSVDELKQRLQNFAKRLNAKTPSAGLRAELRFVGPAVLWLLERGAWKAPEAATFLASLAIWTRDRKTDVAAFFRELLVNPKTTPLLPELVARLPFEPEALRPLALALAKASKTEKIDEKLLREDLLAADLSLLSLTIEKLRLAGQGEAAARFEAFRTVRYPKLDASRKWRKENATRHAALLRAAETQRRDEWTRRLAPEKVKLEGILVRRVSDEKILTIPEASQQQPMLYVFFAAWCPHCQETIKHWVQAGFQAKTWESIRLLEVFPGDRSIADFCKLTQLPAKECAKIVSLGDLRGDPATQTKVGVESIPKLMVLDGGHRIRFHDLRLTTGEGADPEQEILLALELAK